MPKENSMPDSFRKTIEICNKLSAQAKPIIEKSHELNQVIGVSGTNIVRYEDPLANVIPRDVTRFSESIRSITENSVFKTLGELASSTVVPNYKFQNPQLSKMNYGISSVVEAFNSNALKVLSESSASFMDSIGSAFIRAMNSPVVEWLRGLDLSPMLTALEGFSLEGDLLERYRSYNQAYLMAMYECKWFPYAAWAADISLAEQVAEVLETSRGASKRREQRIDKLIYAYYTTKEIKQIKRNWRSSKLEPHIKRILGEAIDAHLRGEYALCINSLATMWEGLIYIKAHNVTMQDRQRQRMELTKKELSALTEANDYDKIFSDYFDKFIVSSCNKVGDVVDGVPNRHGVSHSWYSSYPNKKASLNAIMLTDFIILLEPLSVEKTCSNEDEGVE